eukprot:TRINITY_DN863_c4_g1_i1.p1 TRINITY_DN863_c4_g1~~TRINITY_DN863_c4_g1_i1.p1  ORF type:complete len:393 (+),score=44.94 TRINITY_DN863_c4_g1_i1:115-1293(+)
MFSSCRLIYDALLELFSMWADGKREKIAGTVLDTICKIENCPSIEVLRDIVRLYSTTVNVLPFDTSHVGINRWNFNLKAHIEQQYPLRRTGSFDPLATRILFLLAGELSEISSNLKYRAGMLSFVLKNFELCSDDSDENEIKKYLPAKCLSNEVNIVRCETGLWSSTVGSWLIKMYYFVTSGGTITVDDATCGSINSLIRKWEKTALMPSQLISHGIDTLGALLPPFSSFGTTDGWENWMHANEDRIKFMFSQFPFVSIAKSSQSSPHSASLSVMGSFPDSSPNTTSFTSVVNSKTSTPSNHSSLLSTPQASIMEPATFAYVTPWNLEGPSPQPHPRRASSSMDAYPDSIYAHSCTYSNNCSPYSSAAPSPSHSHKTFAGSSFYYNPYPNDY